MPIIQLESEQRIWRDFNGSWWYGTYLASFLYWPIELVMIGTGTCSVYV